MEKQDIFHLARLARIRVTDEEAAALQTEISDVLAYVGVINEITAATDLTKQVGVVSNVFREDVVTNAPDSYTETLLAEAPQRHGRWLQVPKILNPEE